MSLDLSGARALLAAACLSACAGAPVTDPFAPEEPAFRDLRRLVLVRQVERTGAARPRDPLDALADSLAAGGRAARVVEVGPRPRGDDAALAAVRREVEGTVAAALAGPGRRLVRLGPESSARVAAAGDAVVFLLRLGDAALPPAPSLGPGARLGPPDPFAARPAGAALALVDRTGALTWFAWGSAEPLPDEPVNAAEAVDALLRVVRGEPEPDDAALP